MQPEIVKTLTEFVTTVTGVYIDSAQKIYAANMALATEMTKAISRSTSKKN